MRKNTLLKVGTLLFAFTLMTSCFVGGTFAKYVTKGTGTDTARVAKFGVEVKPDGTLFAKEYAKKDDKYTLIGNTVVCLTEDKVVAPGTTKSMTEFNLEGTPEVAVRVTNEADLELANWDYKNEKNESEEYCPLIFTVEGKTYGMYGSAADNTFGSIEVLEQAIEEAVKAHVKEYAPNTNLSNVSTGDAISVSWEWPFSTSPDNDVKDTYLGDQAADGKAAKVSLTVTTTVTQID